MSDHSSGIVGNPELREFLRSRRARITPDDVGLARTPGARRVPGLRRAEVAHLAGVSVDYYVRLERGRNVNASDAVLDAIARALRLNDVERTHLFAVARPVRTPRRAAPLQRVRPGLQRVLDNVTELPALVLGRHMDVLASNPLARALYTDFEALPVRERNMARFVFLDEAARELYVDWAAAARGVVASLHLHAGGQPYDPRFAELIGELSIADADFRRWWADHDVDRRTYGTKRYHHPVVGDLTLCYEALNPTGDPDQTLGLHTADPGSPSEHALRLLASWTAAAPPPRVLGSDRVAGEANVLPGTDGSA